MRSFVAPPEDTAATGTTAEDGRTMSRSSATSVLPAARHRNPLNCAMFRKRWQRCLFLFRSLLEGVAVATSSSRAHD